MVKRIDGTYVAQDGNDAINFNFLSIITPDLFGPKHSITAFAWQLNKADVDPDLAFDENPAKTLLDKILGFCIGAAQPFSSMARDLEDYLRPYGNKQDIYRDALQPLRALQNILRAVLNLLITPIALYKLLSDKDDTFIKKLKFTSLWLLSNLIDSCSSLIRGVQQLLTTPIAWMVKMPIRGLITAIQGFEPIEKNKDIVRLANIALASNDSDVKERYGQQIAKLFFALKAQGHQSSLELDTSRTNTSDTFFKQFTKPQAATQAPEETKTSEAALSSF